MPINIQDKELMLCKNGIKEKVGIWVEQDVLVPDTKPDVMQIISSHVSPYISEVEVNDGKVNVTGKIVYFIIYKVDDEKYNARGIFVTYPFSQTLNVAGIKKGMNVSIKPIVKNVISSLPNERKILVKTEIVFDICVKDFIKVKLINDFSSENTIEKRISSDKFSNIIKNKKSIIASKDDILLSKDAEDLYEILRIESNIKNTDIKESFNKIMLKGDMYLKVMYLSDSKEENIKSTEFTVPFTGMVEFENINDRSKFDIEYMIQDLNITQNQDITTTKALTVEYRIETDITLYEEEEISYVEDFYSQFEDLEYEQREEDVIKDILKQDYDIEVRENLNGVFKNQNLIDYTVDLGNINTSVSSSGIKVNGNARIGLLLQDIDTLEVESKNLEVLIDNEYRKDEVDLKRQNDVLVKLKECKMTQNENNLDIIMNLNLKLDSKLSGKVRIVDNLTSKKIDTNKLDSMNIYVVKENDELWGIAKKYKTSIENIQKINEELRDSSLNVGQKILIIR